MVTGEVMTLLEQPSDLPVLFSCPDESLRQLYTYPSDSLTDILLFDIKEPSWRQVTFETFDHCDKKTWHDQKNQIF